MEKLLSILFLGLVYCGGCVTQDKVASSLLPPPIIAEAILNGKEVQVNHLPHPFNVGGTLPFAVWVDGKRIPLNRNELKAVGQTLNIEFSSPSDSAELHNGAGWIYPLRLVKDDSD